MPHVRGATPRRTRARSVVSTTLTLVVLAAAARASTVRPSFAETTFASGLTRPSAMAFAPDGRLFICEQGGRLRVVENGVLLPAPFVQITVDANGERGLLGVAFDPQFPSNGYVYVHYTAPTPTPHNRVSRFTANGNVALAASEVILLELDALSGATNHNGGALHFGRDGKLYVGVGDNANGANAQTLGNRLGKILRVNADGTIPADNPFNATASGVNRAIWALGLRNPFSFAFHPVTGRMLINDVGASTWEEINEGVAGANYGWPNTEGPTSNPAYRAPIYAYQHNAGTVRGCAISGGAFYAGVPQQYPESYADTYFFGDYCGSWVNQLGPGNALVTPTFASGTVAAVVDVHVGPDGAVYYLARGTGGASGMVMRIAYTADLR